MASPPSQFLAQDAGRSVCFIVSMTILFFDYLLTLADEVRLFWVPRRSSFVVMFFFAARYGTILGHIPVVVGQVGLLGHDRCDGFQHYHQALYAVVIFLVDVLLIMRTHALYGCNRRILWLLILAASVTGLNGLASSLVGEIGTPISTALQLPSGSCNIVVTQSQGYYLAASWTAPLAFDSIIFVMTVYRAFEMKGTRMKGKGVFETMIRDGVLYYCVLMALYLTNIVMFIAADPSIKGTLVTFTNALSSILMNRLMLNIRSSAQTQSLPLLPVKFEDHNGAADIDA